MKRSALLSAFLKRKKNSKDVRLDAVVFATERSNNAAKAANENSRPMAQAALLINGAAASALLAYLTKDQINPTILAALPWSLVAYALGVFLAALLCFYMTEALDKWNFFWEQFARRTEPQQQLDHWEAQANRWWRHAQVCFALSLLCFLVGSFFMAGALFLLKIGPIPCLAD